MLCCRVFQFGAMTDLAVLILSLAAISCLLPSAAGHDLVMKVAVASDAECGEQVASEACALSALQLKSSYANVIPASQLQSGTAVSSPHAADLRQEHERVQAMISEGQNSSLTVKWSSCREIGCFTTTFYPGLCMCNMYCYMYSNCCPDFYEVCQSASPAPARPPPPPPPVPVQKVQNVAANASESNVSMPKFPSQDSADANQGESMLYVPKVPALTTASVAPAHTFYMYRVEGAAQGYPWENVNTGNLAGIMWYLHNEVVERTPRKFGATRIMRYKVTTKATAPLFEKGMNFGLRFAFDFGMCTGPFNCAEQFGKYGYFVGCNYVDQWPTDEWKGQNHYPGATWFSLPGPCSSKRFPDRAPSCRLSDPGGHCAFPNGEGTCTYSYEPAGEISIDELVGIPDYAAFQAKGGREYRRTTDRGRFTSFWDYKGDPAACMRRLEAARQLFAKRCGGDDLPAPPCDFNSNAFFR